MYILKKSFTFDAAHRLANHKGKCRNIHGHTYKVVVTLIGPELNDSDMLIDFGDISNLVRQYLDDHYDHALILDIDEDKLIKALLPFKLKLLTVPGAPTAENMSKWLYEHFHPIFSNCGLGLSIEVWETPTSSAEYHDVREETEEEEEKLF